MHLAKKACASYLKGVHIMKDKEVFKLAAIDHEKLAKSYGLLNAPELTMVARTKEDPETGELIDRKTAAQDRILRLRMEAKARKAQKQVDKAADEESEDDDEDVKIKNQKRTKSSIQNDDQESGAEDEFFIKKRNDTTKAQADGSDSEDEEEAKELPSLSKRALRKIRPEGPYAGKNKLQFDAEGNASKKTESDYMKALRAGDTLKDGSKIEKDADISDDSGKQDKYVTEMKKRIHKNKAEDDKMAKARIKDIRKKHKKRDRAANGDDRDGNDGGEEMVLGTPGASDDDDDQEDNKSGSKDQTDEDDDDESIEEIPLKKRQKTSSEQTGKQSSSEARALSLLKDKTFF